MKFRQVFTFVLFVLLSGCSRKPDAPAAVQTSTQSAGQHTVDDVAFGAGSPKLAQIAVEPVRTVPVDVGNFQAPARIEADPNQVSHVTLPVAGRIASVAVKVGDTIRRAQPLVTVESQEADMAISSSLQAQAAVIQAQAALTQAKSAAAKAQRDLDRERDLFEHNAVAEKAVLSSEAILQQALAAVDQAMAGLQQANAAAEQGRRRLTILNLSANDFGQHIAVRAPISGKVLELSVVPGEFRNDLSASLMRIADLSSVWVTSDVPEMSISAVKIGQPVQISLQAFPSEPIRGRVTLIGDVVDSQSRTVRVHVRLANPQGRFKPEMFGAVQFSEQTETLPTVPLSAVVSKEGMTAVWREVDAGRFRWTPITIGTPADGRVAVLSGLSARERIVTRGVLLLQGI